jgi:hypothetical protein
MDRLWTGEFLGRRALTALLDGAALEFLPVRQLALVVAMAMAVGALAAWPDPAMPVDAGPDVDRLRRRPVD